MRYLTAGESHGPRLTAIIEGFRQAFPLSEEDINKELKRRQGGYGRGARMKIESDRVEITSGVRHELDHGRPDYSECDQFGSPKWLEIMNVAPVEEKRKIYVRSPSHVLVMPI